MKPGDLRAEFTNWQFVDILCPQGLCRGRGRQGIYKKKKVVLHGSDILVHKQITQSAYNWASPLRTSDLVSWRQSPGISIVNNSFPVPSPPK